MAKTPKKRATKRSKTIELPVSFVRALLKEENALIDLDVWLAGNSTERAGMPARIARRLENTADMARREWQKLPPEKSNELFVIFPGD